MELNKLKKTAEQLKAGVKERNRFALFLGWEPAAFGCSIIAILPMLIFFAIAFNHKEVIELAGYKMTVFLNIFLVLWLLLFTVFIVLEYRFMKKTLFLRKLIRENEPASNTLLLLEKSVYRSLGPYGDSDSRAEEFYIQLYRELGLLIEEPTLASGP